MEIQNLFKRYEIKYLLGKRELDAVLSAFPGRMIDDEYGEAAVCSLYFDTPDYRIIRRSLEKPFYKEKLRVRSYGTPADDGAVFLELKKKYNSIVYKRREKMSLTSAENFLKNPDAHSQISAEIAYFLSFYPDVGPTTFIGCVRQAYYGVDDRDLRITFDKDIVCRSYDLDLRLGLYGNPVLPRDMYLMEIKTSGAMPLWLAGTLAENKIYPTSFSKYGRAYENALREIKNKEVNYG